MDVSSWAQRVGKLVRMCRRTDHTTAEEIFSAQIDVGRIDRQSLARELLSLGVGIHTACRVLATPAHRELPDSWAEWRSSRLGPGEELG